MAELSSSSPSTTSSAQTDDTRRFDLSRPGALLHALIAPWMTQSISVIARLGIADLLADGPPRSIAELATSTMTHERSLYRVLRVLTEAGLFVEQPAGQFALTAAGQQLRADAPDSLRAWAILCGDAYHLASWTDAIHSVRTGAPAFDRALGQPFFDYLNTHEAEGRTFDQAMTNLTGPATAGIVAAYDWSDVHSIVDVGGGNGTLLAAILAAHGHVTGVLFDEAVVIERATSQPHLNDALATGRCSLVTGTFFGTQPSGADAYVLKYIVHDWSDEQALRILRACHEAMRPDSRLLLVEHVLTPGSGLQFGSLLDLEMLVLLTGQERSEPEYRDLLARAGLTLTRILPTRPAPTVPTGLSIIEARPAS